MPTWLNISILVGELVNELPTYPNIGYLGGFYDIFHGNPHTTTGVDSGFNGRGLYNFEYTQNLTTTDGRYAIPDYTTVNDALSCSFAFSSGHIADESSYLKSLKVDVEADFKGWGASFSASADYEHVKKVTSAHESTFVTS